MLFIDPDWQDVYENKAAIEKDLGNFKYKGPGWYITKEDTLLIKEHPDGRLVTLCWNFNSARDDIAKNVMSLLLMPVRKDYNA